MCVSVFNALLLAALHDPWAAAFSEDPAVVAMVSRLVLVYAVFAIFDGGNAVRHRAHASPPRVCGARLAARARPLLRAHRLQIASGILRGAGHQRIGAILNFLAFYAVGLPIGFALCFAAGLGLFGLWWGLCIGVCSCMVGFYIIIYRLHWPTEAQRAQERALAEATEAEAAQRNPLASFGIVRYARGVQAGGRERRALMPAEAVSVAGRHARYHQPTQQPRRSAHRAGGAGRR